MTEPKVPPLFFFVLGALGMLWALVGLATSGFQGLPFYVHEAIVGFLPMLLVVGFGAMVYQCVCAARGEVEADK